MDFKKWEPVYEAILEDFGFSREDDQNAANILSHLLIGPNTASTDVLEELISGKYVGMHPHWHRSLTRSRSKTTWSSQPMVPLQPLLTEASYRPS